MAQSIVLKPGLVFFPGYFDRSAQERLRDDIRSVLRVAPLFAPQMPGTGKPFSVRMTNCGPLGWVSDREGYRYQPHHPATGAPWPPIPPQALEVWSACGGFVAPPEACLVNFYAPGARMGLHQDKDEEEFAAPIVSISLGDDGLFRYGGMNRKDQTRSIRLKSGDVIAFGGESRLVFHGVDKIYPGTSDLLAAPGRVNLTLRRVTKVKGV